MFHNREAVTARNEQKWQKRKNDQQIWYTVDYNTRHTIPQQRYKWNKERWMVQKTTVKHDNVISNQRRAESKEKKQICAYTQATIAIEWMWWRYWQWKAATAKPNLIFYVWSGRTFDGGIGGIPYWFCFIRDNNKTPRQLIRLAWLGRRLCDGISTMNILRPDGALTYESVDVGKTTAHQRTQHKNAHTLHFIITEIEQTWIPKPQWSESREREKTWIVYEKFFIVMKKIGISTHHFMVS